MVIETKCRCGKKLFADESLAGQTIQCGVCRREVLVPDPKAAPPEPLVPAVPPPPPSPMRESLYWLLPLAFFPLAISLAQEHEDIEYRFKRAKDQASESVRQRIEQLEQSGARLDDIINAFPGGKLDDTAFLPRNTSVHWAFAATAALAFLALGCFLFSPGTVRIWHLILVGLFTGTFGIALLLLAHSIGILALLIHIPLSRTEDPDFLASWAGFTFGVGLVEELCKLVPLIWLYHRHRTLTWRVACLWGLASGVGFGVNEGIMYSADFYNGIFSSSIYIVRFCSCVALHAVWSASAGISLYHTQSLLKELTERYEYGVAFIKVLFVVMFLHGLYDTLLTKEWNFPALMVAAASFIWLAWQIESTRKKESVPVQPAPAEPGIGKVFA